MTFEFKKATKETAKLRLALFGPSGSGKTFTSLRMAMGLGGKVAFIDTERGSASKYADRFEFDVLELEKKDIPTYVEAIAAAASAGYPVLVIDSLTHAWKELLEEVDRLARTKYRGNTWSAWSEGTPKQTKLVDAILSYPGHVIATMRTKTEWITEKDRNGKTKPIRVGLSPQQGKGIEYEFDLLMELTVEHIATVIKDRTGKYQDAIIEKPGEDLGRDLAAWLSDGVKPQERATPAKESKPPVKTYAPDDSERPFDATDYPTDRWDSFRNYAVKNLDHYTSGEHVANTLKGIIGADPWIDWTPEKADEYWKMLTERVADTDSA